MIEVKNISKKYNGVNVIDNFSININESSFISIVGKSGRGKTTLINLISLLEESDNGKIIIDGKSNFSQKEKLLLRRNIIGNVFQNYALIENETVESNLKIALAYKKNINKNEAIADALNAVDLKGFNKRKIYELSGGEQQRVAIARLILQDCKYIFADEPTGNLDSQNRDIVFDLLKKLNDMGKAVVIVTHDKEIANKTIEMISL